MAPGLPRQTPNAPIATDKRFRRAHVKPSRKRSPASRYAWVGVRLLVLTVVVGYATYQGVTLIAASPSLQIGHMVVRGHERLSTGEVLALVDGLRGENILGVSLDAWQQKLLSSPWVESATIRRVLPSTVEITVRERRPIGIGRLGTSLYLIDASGVIVDEYGPAYADIDLPVIDGLAASPQDGGSIIDVARAEFAARVIAALSARPEIARQISQLDVGDLHDAVVILDGDPAMLRLGDTEFTARLQQYIDLAPTLRERLTEIDYVDLRFDERLYVRPAKLQAKR
ncbi:MAG TPA: FtsQ-type POTRA domain-containing protein [Vicinamibacterales bacterium]|nr:FtsQ-type POTRA domain-containing protein [Vicinamibacterales bacterium]